MEPQAGQTSVVPAWPVRIATRAIWALGLAVLTAIAVFALVELGRDVRSVALAGSAGVAWAIAAMLVAAAIWTAALSRIGPIRSHPLATGLIFVAASRLLAVALVPAPLESDFLKYHNLAIEISQHGPMISDVPTGWPMLLGAAYAVLGAQPVIGQLLNCVLAVVVAALVFDVTQRLWGRREATLALCFFAFAPAQILFTTVLATETPYGLLVLLSFWAALRFGSTRLATAVAIACLLGASNYVRGTAAAVLPAFILLPFLVGARWKYAVAWGGILVAVFLAIQTPIVIHNEQVSGSLSISPVECGPGWSLLVGTDAAHTGQYNKDLFAVVGLQPCSPEFDRIAGQIAMQRLEAHPLDFARLAVKKFPHMWSVEAYGWSYTYGKSPGSDQDLGKALLLVSQATYLALICVAGWGLWRVRKAPPPVVVAIVAILLALVVAHSFLEITPRYHSYMEPLFCVLAGAAAGSLRLPTRLRRGAQSEATGGAA